MSVESLTRTGYDGESPWLSGDAYADFEANHPPMEVWIFMAETFSILGGFIGDEEF